LVDVDLRDAFVLDGRSRRPPRDRVNALLSYGYGMLYREVLTAIIAVGLHPGVGFYHQPRSSAHTLALDLMELFRVAIVDMALIAAINRRTFDPVPTFGSRPRADVAVGHRSPQGDRGHRAPQGGRVAALGGGLLVVVRSADRA
jgi:hypothetical protein